MVPDNLVGIFYGPGGSASLLSIISFGIAFALAALIQGRTPGSTSLVLPFLQEFLDTLMHIILGVVALTPVAVGSLILQAVGQNSSDELAEAMSSLGIVVACILAANLFHTVAVLPSLVYCASRRNPYAHLRGMLRAAGVAAGSSSSAVTLPVTMECCEGLGYDPAISRFGLAPTSLGTSPPPRCR